MIVRAFVVYVASFDIAILELLCYNNFIRLFFSKIPLLAVSEPIWAFGGNSLFFYIQIPVSDNWDFFYFKTIPKGGNGDGANHQTEYVLKNGI